MKVAFIRAASNLANDIFIDEHLGLGYLAATLEVNGAAESKIFEEPAYEIAGLSFETEVVKFSPDVLAFTVDYTNITRTMDLQSRLCSLVGWRKTIPVRVWGGHHASLCADEILQRDLADYVVPGNAEVSFCELVFQIAKGHRPPRGVFLPSGYQYWHRGLSERTVKLPSAPRRDTLRLLTQIKSMSNAARILTSRGCPFSCNFCTTPALRRMELIPARDYRCPEDVAQEIEELRAIWGVHTFYFNDDLFIDGSSQSKLRASKLAQILQARSMEISFHTQLRVDSLYPGEDNNLLVSLCTAGMNRVFLGIESGVDHVLYELGKRTTADQNLQAIRWYEAHGIHVTPGRILFMYNTTWKDFHTTVSFFEACKKVFYLMRRPNFRLAVFPGTDIYSTLKKYNRIKPGDDLRWVEYHFDNESIASFCYALESFFPHFIDVARPLFRLLNMEFLSNLPKSVGQSLISNIRQECEQATCAFFQANMNLEENWNLSAFQLAAEQYLEHLTHIAGSVVEKELCLTESALP